ncbi:hypothetical protein BH11MYX1_BH11MYX1_25290 [soil metagenome]
MRALLLACLVLPSCTPTDDTTFYLTAHVTCTEPFDTMLVSGNDGLPAMIALAGPTMMADYHHEDEFGDFSKLGITVTLDGNAVATGTASNIAYRPISDFELSAEITMALTP